MTEHLSVCLVLIKLYSDIIFTNLESEKFGVKEISHESSIGVNRIINS